MKTLTDIIYQYKDKQFTWGVYDCCVFVATCVEQYTGKELPKWKEVVNYKNKNGAMKALRKLGCKKLSDLPQIILDTPKIPISKVKTGYPVYYVNEEGEGILGICNGAQSYFINREKGLATRRTEECLYCWSID